MTDAQAPVRFPAWAVVAGAALVAFAVFLFAPQVLNDGDTYWHLAAGDWMLSHRAVPHQDPFSFTRPGAPWQAHEWLSEVLMSLAYKAGGWSGFVLLFAATTAAAATLLAARLSRSLGGISLVVTLTLAFACMGPSLLARPHVLVLPVLMAWAIGLLSAREKDRAPPLAMAGLMILWANLHGSYVFGFVLLAAFALEALVEAAPGARWKVVRQWGLFGVLALAASLVTPHGVSGLLFPFKLMTMTILDGVSEWRAVDFSEPGPFEAALVATLFVCLSRGVRVAPVRLALLLFLLHMALQHVRHLIVLAAVAPLILAAPLAVALGQPRPLALRWCAAAIAFAAIALPLAALRLALPVQRTDNPTTPMTALANLPTGLSTKPVLNDYGFGGYLIFTGVKPFIDGRADMYGDDFVKRYFKIASPDAAALDRAIEEYRIVWTLLPPKHPLVPLMDGRPSWRRLYTDAFAVVHVREERF